MRINNLIKTLNIYKNRPNLNLSQFKELFLIFFNALSLKEQLNFTERMNTLDFNLESLLDVQITLNKTLSRINRINEKKTNMRLKKYDK